MNHRRHRLLDLLENSPWSQKECTYSKNKMHAFIYKSMLLFCRFRWPLQVQVQPEQKVILHTIKHENNPVIKLESLNRKYKHLNVHWKSCHVPKIICILFCSLCRRRTGSNAQQMLSDQGDDSSVPSLSIFN